MNSVLLEARPFRPFKSSEEYLYAMKEDLAEWFQTMYPHLNIAVDNFMERLETGVALCEHANAVKAQAHEYVEKKQAKKVMTKSVTGSLAIAQTLTHIADVKYFNTAKAGTFFARDNVSNFINWCRNSLKIIECLLFESDDLIMRKNEKHVILCLLEVARRGAKFGMLAPMLVQMERQIDREIAADQKKLGVVCNENHNGIDDDSDSDMDDEETVLMYGPVPQIITNDLKSLDEMVRDLVEKCTCPTQFPMIRVSEGKYRIGDTKVLIFVRILRNHVMVRVGGGWDTLAHYLDKHDPCRCKSQHRTTQSARLVNRPGAPDLHGSHVYYDRVPAITTVDSVTNGVGQPHSTLGPPMNSLNRSRSRSPSYQSYMPIDSRRSVSPNFPRKSLIPPDPRSRSPTPNLNANPVAKKHRNSNSGPQSLPIISTSPKGKDLKGGKVEANQQVNDTDHSDTTSEMSDEGYRSLGVVQDKNRQRSSLYSQNSIEDAEENEHQQMYTEEELNDFGLRKTKFSQIIYETDDMKQKLERNVQSVERLTESPVQSPEELKEFKEFKPEPKPKEKVVRANSAERKLEVQKSPKRQQNKKTESKISTWNGRTKTARPSLTSETYISPFNRNSIGRRSVSAVSYERRSSSTNTSPTKSRLKQELLQAVKKADDDETIALQVQELLKKYGSLNTLNDFEPQGPSQEPIMKRNTERMSFRSPRKDSRPENHVSRIPAPVIYNT